MQNDDQGHRWYLSGPALFVSAGWLFVVFIGVLGGNIRAFEHEFGRLVFWGATLAALFVVGAIFREILAERKPRK